MLKIKICFLLLTLALTPAANALCELGNTYFIASVLKTESGIEVWINTRSNWVERGALVDTYTEEEQTWVDAITEHAGLCELAESQYEPCRSGATVEGIKSSLLQKCVENDKDFQSWSEKEISGN